MSFLTRLGTFFLAALAYRDALDAMDCMEEADCAASDCSDSFEAYFFILFLACLNFGLMRCAAREATDLMDRAEAMLEKDPRRLRDGFGESSRGSSTSWALVISSGLGMVVMNGLVEGIASLVGICG